MRSFVRLCDFDDRYQSFPFPGSRDSFNCEVFPYRGSPRPNTPHPPTPPPPPPPPRRSCLRGLNYFPSASSFSDFLSLFPVLTPPALVFFHKATHFGPLSQNGTGSPFHSRWRIGHLFCADFVRLGFSPVRAIIGPALRPSKKSDCYNACAKSRHVVLLHFHKRMSLLFPC